jgi:hypothetical protein
MAECPLCAGNSPIYHLTSICCCVRLILAQPNRQRRAAILHLISRRQYANVDAVRQAVEAAFGSRNPSRPSR